MPTESDNNILFSYFYPIYGIYYLSKVINNNDCDSESSIMFTFNFH